MNEQPSPMRAAIVIVFSDEYSCRRMRIIGEANGTFVT